MRENNWKQKVVQMENYLPYQGKKYIAPSKAGEHAIEMEEFKLAGQEAREAFQTLVASLLGVTNDFRADRVSAWMNQAQVGRPHFWCYFFLKGGTRLDPTFAVRLKTIAGRLGISCELSFIERGSTPETLARQNRVLEVLLDESLDLDGVYYWAQIAGESYFYNADERSRQTLTELVEVGSARKVLMKYGIPTLADFVSVEELCAEIQKGFDKLIPFFEVTR